MNLIISVISLTASPAISMTSGIPASTVSQEISKTTVRGIVTDAPDGHPIEYAQAVLTDKDGRIIASGYVNDGKLIISDVPAGKTTLTISLLGYEPYTTELDINGTSEINIGAIVLVPQSEALSQGMVTADKNRITYKLDRQVLSASSAITAAGGTAADILRNAPSVQTDSEGNISLRGSSNFLVYVDGKLSPLEGAAALQQIPAGNVEDVEIITTPSARYRSDGDAGIINITTRKSREGGWSGLLNLSGSTLGTWSADGELEYAKGHDSWYIGGTAQDIKRKSDFHQDKTTVVSGITTNSVADGERWRNTGTKTIRSGWQHADGKHHNLSIDLLIGSTCNKRGGDMSYDENRKSSDMNFLNTYEAHDVYKLNKDLSQASLTYLLKPVERHEISLTARCRYDKYSIEYTESNMFDMHGNRYEGTRGYEEEHHWDADGSLAWKWSWSKEGQLEAGYQYVTYSEHGGYRIKYWDRPKQEFVWQDDLATPFYYRRQVHTLYGMISDRLGKFSYDAGLRADEVHDVMNIEVADASRNRWYGDIFPSAHISYDAGNIGPFTIGYSYRTNRPGIWNLEPYITYEDYFTKKMGNPDIRPEYIHSAELGWRKSFAGGVNIAATAYYRYRTDITDWVRSALEPGVTLDEIVNAGDQTEYGMEAIGNWAFAKWWDSSLSGSAFKYIFTSTCPVCTDRDGVWWQAKWSNTFKASSKTKIQFDAFAIGPKILTQGRENGFYYCTLAAKRQICKDRISIGLVAEDILHTAKYHNIRTTKDFTSITDVRPKYPNMIISLTYNFNASSKKAGSVHDASIFEGKEF